MRRRLYFMLPDMHTAHRVLDEMLLARIEERHIHFLARRGTLPPDLPEASVLQKTDFVHGAGIGLVIGGGTGVIAGALLVLFPPHGGALQLVTVLITAVLGALFGAWMASMAASAVPNSMLKRFHPDIERGKVLMMIDVPLRREREISGLIASRHPEVEAGGIEPTLAFP
ncbi:MAG: DUF1269 domain-containing protein [Pseudomonadota bacterium]